MKTALLTQIFRFEAAHHLSGTAENLTHWIWDRLSAAGFPEGLLYRIRLWETDTGFAEITQEERG